MAVEKVRALRYNNLTGSVRQDRGTSHRPEALDTLAGLSLFYSPSKIDSRKIVL